jgi:hypothetical protein
MTEHKGLPVHGYRDQSDPAVDAVNENKLIEERILRRLDLFAQDSRVDKRWLAVGRTGIEQAFMAINRAVFQPGRVRLPEDPEFRFDNPPGQSPTDGVSSKE